MENLNKQLTMSGPKIRAKSFGVFGKEKHKIIKSVMSRYNTAMEHISSRSNCFDRKPYK